MSYNIYAVFYKTMFFYLLIVIVNIWFTYIYIFKKNYVPKKKKFKLHNN